MEKIERLFQTLILLMPGILALPLVSACIAAQNLHDPVTYQAAQSVHDRAASFFTALKAKSAPECDFAHNAADYDQLSNLAVQLHSHLAEKRASVAMLRAADALGNAITHARTSHELASTQTNEINGACLDPVALALNADAIARASAAIAETQSPH